MIKILILAAAVASLYGTSKVLLGIVDRAESSTSGYSTLGMFLTVVYAISIGLGKNKKYFPSKYVWYIVLIILLTGILFTYNRTHWGIVGLITLFVAITHERILLIVPVVFAAIIILFVPSLSERFIQLIYFNQNLSDRDVIWCGAYQLMFDHPFAGFGTRTFKEIFPLFDQMQDKGVASWHSDYLQMYFESGLIGLIAFLLLMFTIFKNGIRVIKNKITSELSSDILFAVLLGLSAFYLTAFVGGFILDPINSILFQFLIAIIGVISAKALKEKNVITK
jgi:O-antigen ligase